jgi:uncharacterized repeat protein (TIGR03803 family)
LGEFRERASGIQNPQKRNAKMRNNKKSILLVMSCAAVFGFLATASPAFAAGSEQTLYNFCNHGDNCAGIFPSGGLIFDTAGNLYSTTSQGGTSNEGTVFELMPNGGVWTEQTLYNFCSAANCADGSSPYGGVIFDTAGNLYGTTLGGGAYGQGTVFELVNNNGTWTEKVLHSFTGGDDGGAPDAGLVIDAGGNLYGTTFSGGAYHSGTVFELIPNNGTWTEKALHWFKAGAKPDCALVLDRSGNIYGTTADGGIYGYGSVFELIPANGHWIEKVIHSFNINSKGGYALFSGVILDSSGNLYGTTSRGGAFNGGTAFELTPGNGSWTLRILVAFKPIQSAPVELSGLILGKSGNLYGTTRFGGAHFYGSVFKLIPNNGTWSEKLLFSFNQTDGEAPWNVILDASGNLYGTTENGGTYGYGTVFEVTP